MRTFLWVVCFLWSPFLVYSSTAFVPHSEGAGHTTTTVPIPLNRKQQQQYQISYNAIQAAAVYELRDEPSSLFSPSQFIQALAPKLGVLTSLSFYLAPSRAIWTAVRQNSMQRLNPLPVAVLSIVTLSWFAYGFATEDRYLILSNLGGCMGSSAFVMGMLPLMHDNLPLLRAVQGVIWTGATTTFGLWAYLGYTRKNRKDISRYLGWYASGLFILLTASPLSTIRTVVATRNASSILASTMITQVVDSLLWSVYGVARKDRFLWGPSAVGLGLALVQLALKLTYPSI